MEVEITAHYEPVANMYKFYTRVTDYSDSISTEIHSWDSIKPVSVYVAPKTFVWAHQFYGGLTPEEVLIKYLEALKTQVVHEWGFDMPHTAEIMVKAEKVLSGHMSMQAYQSFQHKYQPTTITNTANSTDTEFWKHYKAKLDKNKYYASWSEGGNDQSMFSELSHILPGVKEEVEYPCKNFEHHVGEKGQIRTIIIHMNDVHKWTREQIADWLDELHDSGVINIEFEVDVDERGGES